MYWAGHKKGKNYSAQGNILTGPEVVDGMAAAFEKTEGSLAERLVAALEAGQEAGGDSRGRQSAALLVVQKARGVTRTMRSRSSTPMVAAETMVGINGNKVYALPHDRLQETLRQYNRLELPQ